jgi:hypothetical protein
MPKNKSGTMELSADELIIELLKLPPEMPVVVGGGIFVPEDCYAERIEVWDFDGRDCAFIRGY